MMSKEVRDRVRPWTHVPGPRKRREKTMIAVPTVDTYRQHMEYVQTAYQRLRLDASCDRTQTSSSSSSSSPSPSAGFPSILPYRMTRSHTFAASPRQWRGAAAWSPLLEFSSPSSSSRRSSVVSPDPHKHEESSSRVPSRKVSTVHAPSLQQGNKGCSAGRTVPNRSLQVQGHSAMTPFRKVSWGVDEQRGDSQHTGLNDQRVASPPHINHPAMSLFTLTREETKILSHPDNKQKGSTSSRPQESKTTSKDEDASSSGVSSRTSSCHDIREEAVTSYLNHNGYSSEHVQHSGEMGSTHPAHHTGALENGESPRIVEHHELEPKHPERDHKRGSARTARHKKKESLGYSDHLSSLDQPMDILQLCEHLKTRGLGEPVMSTHSHNGPQTRALPPGMKARCLPRNPSTREKIKGRARLDQELANMRAAAFCEQQQTKMFRTASDDLRDRDVRLLEEEERENVHKEAGKGVAEEVLDDDDDASSMVCSPLSREELFCRIEAWADEVHEALHRGDHRHS
ncbi:uncharacterized protein [Littorina saxatilis]|uniref:Uncharacterized protein n=1 Tax=Littorina saxatilis TaxID=31220 RepID=A0AAN9BTJ2_9CAEN